MRGARMKTPRSGSLVAGELDVGLEAPHLAAVRVPVDLEVREPEMGAVEHDHPGAGPEHRRRGTRGSRRRARTARRGAGSSSTRRRG